MRVLSKPIESTYQPDVSFDAQAVAAPAWQGLVEATQKDYRERGLVVGQHAGRSVVSKVFEGYAEEIDPETGKVEAAGCYPPALPFGLRGLRPSFKSTVLVHTHPMPPNLDHIKTTVISDKDIRCFANSPYNGLVVLDRGGAHLLAKTDRYHRHAAGTFDDEAVTRTIKEIVEEGLGSMDLITRLAYQLSAHGLGYFYRSRLRPEGGDVAFKNLRVARPESA